MQILGSHFARGSGQRSGIGCRNLQVILTQAAFGTFPLETPVPWWLGWGLRDTYSVRQAVATRSEKKGITRNHLLLYHVQKS